MTGRWRTGRLTHLACRCFSNESHSRSMSLLTACLLPSRNLEPRLSTTMALEWVSCQWYSALAHDEW